MGQILCSLDMGRVSHLQQDSEALLGVGWAATAARDELWDDTPHQCPAR